jgi:hypothetical protein
MNLGLFRTVISALRTGGCLGFAPEGVSRFLPYMEQPFKTGVARIALEAVRQASEAGQPAFRVNVVTVGLVFTHREKFRSDLCMRYCKPIVVDEAYRKHFADEFEAARVLTQQISDSLEARVGAGRGLGIAPRRARAAAAPRRPHPRRPHPRRPPPAPPHTRAGSPAPLHSIRFDSPSPRPRPRHRARRSAGRRCRPRVRTPECDPPSARPTAQPKTTPRTHPPPRQSAARPRRRLRPSPSTRQTGRRSAWASPPHGCTSQQARGGAARAGPHRCWFTPLHWLGWIRTLN